MPLPAPTPHIYEYGYYQQLFDIEEHHEWCRGMRTVMDALLKEPLSRLGSLNVLDIGCGAGHLIRYLHENYRCKEVPAGLDVSEHALEFCKQRGLSRLVLESASEISFSDGSFNLLTCIDTLQHLNSADEQKALSEFARVLSPGGLLYLRTNSQVAHGDGQADTDRYRRYTVDQLKAKVERHGFKVLSASYINVIGAVAGGLRESLNSAKQGGHHHHDHSASHKHESNDIGPGLTINKNEIGKLRTRVAGFGLQVEARLLSAKLTMPFGHSIALVGQRL